MPYKPNIESFKERIRRGLEGYRSAKTAEEKFVYVDDVVSSSLDALSRLHATTLGKNRDEYERGHRRMRCRDLFDLTGYFDVTVRLGTPFTLVSRNTPGVFSSPSSIDIDARMVGIAFIGRESGKDNGELNAYAWSLRGAVPLCSSSTLSRIHGTIICDPQDGLNSIPRTVLYADLGSKYNSSAVGKKDGRHQKIRPISRP